MLNNKIKRNCPTLHAIVISKYEYWPLYIQDLTKGAAYADHKIDQYFCRANRSSVVTTGTCETIDGRKIISCKTDYIHFIYS